MNFFKSCLHFTKAQRSGLVALLCLIAMLQLCVCFADFTPPTLNPQEQSQWLALQPVLDSLNKPKAEKRTIYPFNPNFITDFKGYKLGMSVAEIDRLLAFRKTGKFVNSAAEFQAVTKVPDSFLAKVSPYFKFPDWVTRKASSQPRFKKPERTITDINTATKEDLVALYGIGEALSLRILAQREKLGAFVSMDQMEDIWGLSPEVVLELRKAFKIVGSPPVAKLSINDASVKELAQFPYFRYALAREIVTFRSMHGRIKNADDLQAIKNFPRDKIPIIAVYLEF